MNKENQGAAAPRKELDKSKWQRGEWDNEPDRIEFEHAGLPCLMRRVRTGTWCGYAAVPPGHPLHGKGYDDVQIDAHGGLTYANACSGSICHVPKPGEPDDVWWFGFDCAHYMDFVPMYDGDCGAGEYRNVAYVRSEVQRLAEQLASAASAEGPRP